MRAVLILAAAAGAALSLSACVYNDYGAGRGGGYSHAGVGGPGDRYGPRSFEAYYDGYYGDYAGGRWGDDGTYYYRRGGRDGGYVRDEGGHFRRDAGLGFHAVGSADVGLGGIGAGASVGVGVGAPVR